MRIAVPRLSTFDASVAMIPNGRLQKVSCTQEQGEETDSLCKYFALVGKLGSILRLGA